MNGWERNARVFEFLQGIAENDDALTTHIVTTLPEDEGYPFLVTVGHRGLGWLALLLGDDWRDHLRVQAMEARMVADEHQGEEDP